MTGMGQENTTQQDDWAYHQSFKLNFMGKWGVLLNDRKEPGNYPFGKQWGKSQILPEESGRTPPRK